MAGTGSLPSYASAPTNTGGAPGPNPFTFRGLTLNSVDCPTELTIGTGEQKMVVSETVGGGKVTHVTGFFPDTNTWSGVLHQPNVEANIAIMRSWMVDGKEGLVTWKGEQYYGIVKKFTPRRYKGGQRCQWTLDVEITRANNGAFSIAPVSSVDDTVSTLFQTINMANTTIQNVYGTVSGTVTSTPTAAQTAAANFNTQFGLTSSAVTAASPLATASTTAIASATAAVASAQATVPAMLSAFPSGSDSYIAAEQINTALTVAGANIGSVQSQATIQQQGGSLFALAATKYGDPSQAYALMSANGLVAPMLPGSNPTTLVLPPLPGIFNDGTTTYSQGIVGGSG